MRRARAAAAAAAAAAVVFGTLGVEAAPARWHFDFGTWRVSIFFEREDGKGDTTRLLLEAGSRRFVFLSQQDPSFRDSTESIQLAGGGETFARRLVLHSFEGIPSCSSIPARDACVVFTGKNGSFGAPISAFAGEAGARTRERAAALVSHAMRDALFSLEPVLPSLAEFGSYSKDFLGLVWPERFAKEASLRRGVRKPGCAFDETFGFPCTDADRAREARRFPDAR